MGNLPLFYKVFYRYTHESFRELFLAWYTFCSAVVAGFFGIVVGFVGEIAVSMAALFLLFIYAGVYQA